MKRFRSLKTKYLLICLIICSFSILAVSSISFYFSNQIASGLTNDVLREKTDKTAMQLNNWFNTYSSGISQVIEDIKTFGDYEPEHLHPLLKSKLVTYKGKISDFYFGYAKGNKTLSGVGWTPPADYVASSRPWYKKAAAAEGVVFTDPYVDAMTGELIITVAQALRIDGVVVGVLASDIFLSDVIQVVNHSKINENSYGMLLDDQGRLIAHPNPAYLPDQQGIKSAEQIDWPAYTELVSLVQDSEGNETHQGFELKDYTGSQYVYHFSLIGTSQWHFGIAVDKAVYREPLKILLLAYLLAFVVSGFIAFIIIEIFVTRMVRPIKALNAAMHQFSLNKQVRTVVESEDEIGEVNQSFNDMADTLEAYSQNLKKNLMFVEVQRNAFARFVPETLLTLFDKQDISDVSPRDRKSLDMTVMFSDIRSYTAITESLSSAEIFELLNNYFYITNPIIEKNNGIIDKYIGDAIMALFPKSPDDALRSAIEIKRMLKVFNQSQKENHQPELLTGMGLHYGYVEIGAVGDEKRLQATVIGDAVNLASRLESATKLYGVEMIISDAVHLKLKNPDEFNLRMIDTVRVKGKETPIIIYEVFDADDPAVIEKKLKINTAFSEGMDCYKKGEFEKAHDLFKTCAEACPEDSVSPVYVKRCTTLMRIPPGDDWAGISTL